MCKTWTRSGWGCFRTHWRRRNALDEIYRFRGHEVKRLHTHASVKNKKMHILLGCVLLDVFKGYVFHVFRCVFEPVLHSSCLAFRCFLEEDVCFVRVCSFSFEIRLCTRRLLLSLIQRSRAALASRSVIFYQRRAVFHWSMELFDTTAKSAAKFVEKCWPFSLSIF